MAEAETNQNILKPRESDNTSIFPGDPQGSPDESFCSLILVSQRKAYKSRLLNYSRMFPSDPHGSLDVFFLRSYLSGRRFGAWKKQLYL